MARSTHNRRRDDNDEDPIEDAESSQPRRWPRQNESGDEQEDGRNASQSSAPADSRNSKNKGKGKKRAATPPSDDASGPEADADQDLPPFDPTAFRDQPIAARASDKFAEVFQMWHEGIAPLDILEKHIRETAMALTEAGEEGNPEVCIIIYLIHHVGVSLESVTAAHLVAFLKHSSEFLAHRHLRRPMLLCVSASI